MDYIINLLMLLGGYIIAEIIRRINRAENLNSIIFEKRLNAFVELYHMINVTYEQCNQFLSTVDNTKESFEEINEKYVRLMIPLTIFLDENALFFSDDLIVQCGATFLGPENFSKEQYKNNINDIQQEYTITKDMIKNESGMTMLNKSIKHIIKFKHKSAVVSYYKALKKEKLSK